MAERPPGDFGRRLREARERRGISLRQIANATKIGMSALEALERNDISRLPGGIFSRAFVRAYAVEVGLEPEATVQEFIAQFPDDSVTAGHPTSTKPEDHEAVESERRTATAFARLIALSVPIAAAVMYFGLSGRPVDAPSADLPIAAAVEPASAPTSGTAAAATPAAVPAGVLTMSLAVLRECWVSVEVDGVRVFEQLLQPGEQRTIEARREVVLTAGDASALAIRINGRAARPLGGQGKVVTTRVTPDNFREYLSIQ